MHEYSMYQKHQADAQRTCTDLSFESWQQRAGLYHPTFAENGHALDTVMASLSYGYLSASAQTTVDSASATEDMQAAQNHLEAEAHKAQLAAQKAAQAAQAARVTAARLQQFKTGAITPRTVRRSSTLSADSVVRSNFKSSAAIACPSTARVQPAMGAPMVKPKSAPEWQRDVPSQWTRASFHWAAVCILMAMVSLLQKIPAVQSRATALMFVFPATAARMISALTMLMFISLDRSQFRYKSVTMARLF